LAIVDSSNPRTETSDVLIAANRINANNRQNTSTEGDLERIPLAKPRASMIAPSEPKMRVRTDHFEEYQ